MIKRILVAALAVGTLAGVAHAQKPSGEKGGPKSEKPTQTSVAAKGKSFGTIAATDAKVTSATKAEDLTAAKKHLDKTASFVGTVAKVFAPKSNSVVLLNFAKDYKTALIGTIKSSNFAAFPDLKTLEGKKVLVTGKVIDFHGQTEIELTGLEDIKIVP